MVFFLNSINDTTNYPNGADINRIGLVIRNASVTAGNLHVHNGYIGIEVLDNSVFRIDSLNARYNSNSGLLVGNTSTAVLLASSVVSNNGYGITVIYNGIFTSGGINGTSVQNNNFGIYCDSGRALTNHMTITSNNTNDLYASNGGTIQAVGSSFNTTSPAINTFGNYGAFIRN